MRKKLGLSGKLVLMILFWQALCFWWECRSC